MHRGIQLVVVARGALVAVPSQSCAESLARTCRRICQDEIQACVDAGGGPRAKCRRSVLRECRLQGVSTCLDAGEEARKAGGTTSLYAPVVLNAQAMSSTLVSLSWSDSNDREHGYSVERSMNGTTFAEITQTLANG